ncbi:hypothetical protein Cpir12675_000027 [Ceratocystis pirilliformis]|uniref:Glycoside hydrolase family 3 N-terminal domain-containing protein n=1 Tax=Ceratocystis pirilliformis TaxID=259994 RepID=A0ABR3ZPN6_9PEZI
MGNLTAEAMGQMLIMGWDGTEVTPQIKRLIAEKHLGSIILTAKNLKSAQQTAKLVQELQTIAKQSGHPQPLLIALDQENGGVNSLFDDNYVCQFPSAMGIGATGRSELAYEVTKATATEIAACGINLMLGPVLDVLSNARYQPLGVRATSDDPQEVSEYATAAIRGIKDAGIACCGKHFPSYGNLDFGGSNLDMPIITQTLEELSLSALIPFRNSIATGNLDGMFVGGCAISNPSLNVQHACLSDQVVDYLLRNELKFDGIAISECLEMEALSHEIGVQNGVVMAVEAGCDLVLLCRAYPVQLEAIEGLRLGVESGIISKARIMKSVQRVLKVKAGCTSWAKALNPPGISLLSQLHPSHLALSKRAYDSSIAVIRDNEKLIPLSHSIHPQEEILLLTPLVKPLPASTLTKLNESKHRHAPGSQTDDHERWSQACRAGAIMTGEEVFRELGRSLARTRNGKLLHTSYTANGLRPVHENLINRASCVIIVTADANRNKYQFGFAKHVDMMCSMLRSRGQKKHLIVVAVSSPYDFAMDKTIGTYICTFDFTETAMHALVRTLFGKCPMTGTLPGTLRKTRNRTKSRQPWLVEPYDRERDCHSLDKLIKSVVRNSVELPTLEKATSTAFHLPSCGAWAVDNDSPSPDKSIPVEAHFVVRNSSTGALYGFVATWIYPVASLGVIGTLLVDPVKRNVSIGRSLHRRAVRSFAAAGVTKAQLGTAFPAVFLGIPTSTDSDTDTGVVHDWFAASGWTVQFPTRLAILAIPLLSAWSAPDGLLTSMQRAGLSFDLVHGIANAGSVEAHVASCAGPDIVAFYRAALADGACGVVRAKCGDTILGSVVFARAGSMLSNAFPLPTTSTTTAATQQQQQTCNKTTAAILAPVVSTGREQQALVLQGLALMGVRQSKANKCESVVLCLTIDESEELLHAMGFENVQTYDSLTTSLDCLTGA